MYVPYFGTEDNTNSISDGSILRNQLQQTLQIFPVSRNMSLSSIRSKAWNNPTGQFQNTFIHCVLAAALLSPYRNLPWWFLTSVPRFIHQPKQRCISILSPRQVPFLLPPSSSPCSVLSSSPRKRDYH